MNQLFLCTEVCCWLGVHSLLIFTHLKAEHSFKSTHFKRRSSADRVKGGDAVGPWRCRLPIQEVGGASGLRAQVRTHHTHLCNVIVLICPFQEGVCEPQA